MDIVNDIVNSPSAYLTMFIVLLGYVLHSSQNREKEMREQLDKTVPVLEKILTRLDVIEDKLEKLDDNLTVWKHKDSYRMKQKRVYCPECYSKEINEDGYYPKDLVLLIMV